MKQSLQGANGFFFYRLGAQLTGVMGLLGLVLAIVGVYSVVSYVTAQRNHEIGIRMAIGAGSGEILKMVLRQSLWVVAVGIAVGLGAAFAGTRVLGAFILGVSPSDPLTFGVVVAVLSGVALLACWLPARRATKVDPLIALRYE
jgi:ABC-type antimicrobial peptide transport system permease subunit